LPSPAELGALYSDDYTFKRPERDGSFSGMLASLEWRLFYLPGYRQRAKMLRLMTGFATGRLLEVGCGNGLFLDVLRTLGWQVEGVETSRNDVDYARGTLGLKVVHGSLDEVEQRRASFDLVVAVYVLEHIPSPSETLERIHGLLKPGGKVVLGLPMLDSLQSRLLGRRWSAITEAPRHVFVPTMQGARRLLERSGFRDVRIAPAPVIENAGHVALSILPSAATPGTRGKHDPIRALLRRLAGAALLVPGLAVAGLERLGQSDGLWSGTMFLAGEKR